MNKIKPFLISSFVLAFFLIVCSSVLAKSEDYVLPYPSFMPGNKLYQVKETWDKFKGLFMFGNFTKFSYELQLADKKLVEAKVLYEYGQIALGNKALEKYQTHMMILPKLLAAANKEGKNISEKERLLKQALKKHQQVLWELSQVSP
ncbi:hypothetical protein HZA75_06580 [Candidatus Roizmanbacteria bacterium]|nr:hypothetical protein [Candidatus Roizmanbacteria bacterium]